MSQQCPHCRLAVQDGDTFCGECGGVLVLRPPSGRGGPTPWSRPSANQDTGPLDPPLRAWPAPPPAMPSVAGAPPAAPLALPVPPDPPGPLGPAGSWGEPGQTAGAGRLRPVPAAAVAQAPVTQAGAAVGLPAVEPAHRAEKVDYQEMSDEPVFDPLRNARLGRQMLRQTLLFVLAGFLIEGAITLLFAVMAFMSRSTGPLGAAPVFSVLAAGALLLVYLFTPVPALIAQWSRLLGLRADAAGVAFEHIQHAIARHQLPHDSLIPVTKRPPGEGERSYLELQRGVFAGYISCFAHGNDLYIGMTFWICLSPARLALMRLGRQFQDLGGQGNDIYQTLRYDSTRATIAAMYDCTLEGVDAALRSTGAEPRPAPVAAMTGVPG